MDRRTFITMVGGSSLVAPVSVETQQAPKLYRIGVLTGSATVANVEAFRQGLRDLGYREGTDVVILHSDVDGRFDRLDAAVAQLIQHGVDVIVAGGSESVQAARRATASIPIVMTTVGDPVGQGFVASFAKPGVLRAFGRTHVLWGGLP